MGCQTVDPAPAGTTITPPRLSTRHQHSYDSTPDLRRPKRHEHPVSAQLGRPRTRPPGVAALSAADTERVRRSASIRMTGDYRLTAGYRMRQGLHEVELVDERAEFFVRAVGIRREVEGGKFVRHEPERVEELEAGSPAEEPDTQVAMVLRSEAHC